MVIAEIRINGEVRRLQYYCGEESDRHYLFDPAQPADAEPLYRGNSIHDLQRMVEKDGHEWIRMEPVKPKRKPPARHSRAS